MIRSVALDMSKVELSNEDIGDVARGEMDEPCFFMAYLDVPMTSEGKSEFTHFFVLICGRWMFVCSDRTFRYT